MAKRVYTVCVNEPRGTDLLRATKWDYPAGYFPRRFHYKKDAIACAKEAVAKGATMARVEFPGMGEMDFRPGKG